MSDLMERLNYYIKNKMDVGPLELEVYRDEIERLTAKCRAANAKQYKARLELKQANAVVDAARNMLDDWDNDRLDVGSVGSLEQALSPTQDTILVKVPTEKWPDSEVEFAPTQEPDVQ